MRNIIIPIISLINIVHALWPVPSQVQTGDQVLFISPDVAINYEGGGGVSIGCGLQGQVLLTDGVSCFKTPSSYGNVGGSEGDPASSDTIQTAITETKDTLFSKNFIPWKFHPRNSNFEPQPDGTTISSIVLTTTGDAQATANISHPTDGQIDESYSLSITIYGQVTITAPTAIGVAYGLNTLTQLFYAHSQGGAYMTTAPVQIDDKPVFVHRGLNMDVTRTYYEVKDILRTIDALAYNKFNRLHVHITDGQAWPLVIPAMPELSDKGAYAPGQVYTPEQLQDLQHYGASRGVEVFLEIDMPGHTSSIAFSHPELIAAFNTQPDWPTYCAEPPCGTLQLNNTEVYAFLDKLFSDLLPRVSQNNAYFHTGGDEVKFAAYEFDPTVGTNDTAVLQPLLQKFFDYIHENITSAGLTQVVWEELLLTYNLTIPDDVLIQSWQSDQAVQQIVQSGHKAIAGNYDYWYLDCGHGQWVNFEPGPISQKYFPYSDYCAPFKNWRLMYSYDPLSGVPPEQANMVLGGEASIWSEQSDGISIDGIIWPRLAAAGEVLWSGAKDPATGQNRSQVTAAPRLSEMRERLVARGVQAATIQMPFCTQNGTQCTQPD